MPDVTAAYIRVSSKSQDYRTQRDAIERTRSDVASWYEEKKSAKTTARPELQQLLADARAGKFTTLVVFKLDRLCRSGVADTFAVVQELRRSGVTLVCTADNLTVRPDSEDMVSTCYVFALGLSAKLERQAINERISAARERMEEAGEPWGRPPRMTSAQRATAQRMRTEGRSVREISAALGVPRTTVGRLVRAPRGQEASSA